MTTRIHIVNFGPDPIEVTKGSSQAASITTLYPQESINEYVYDGQEIEIREQKKSEV